MPLRIFLGVTFCFAGLQKLANPNFLTAASPISIQAQLRAAERTSPIHAILGPLTHIGALIGVVISIAEIAIGLGVLAGVLTRVAAAGGMLLSFGLFLTVSFHARPYYTGADIGYVFAFTPLLIAGSGRRLTLSALADYLVEQYPRRRPTGAMDEQRRRFLLAGALGTFGLILAGLDAGLGRLVGAARVPQQGPHLPSSSSPATTGRPAGPGPGSSSTVQGPPSGTKIGPASAVPVGGAASFQDPASGDPAIVIQAKAGNYVAFDAVCPHAGCTVNYSQQQDIIFCPCHGSLFNAATGSVEQGPAATGLKPIRISEGPDAQLYAD